MKKISFSIRSCCSYLFRIIGNKTAQAPAGTLTLLQLLLVLLTDSYLLILLISAPEIRPN